LVVLRVRSSREREALVREEVRVGERARHLVDWWTGLANRISEVN